MTILSSCLMTFCLFYANFFGYSDAAYVTHVTSPVVASVGEEVVMECEVDGVPKLDGMVKWLRGEQIIEGVSLVGQTRAVMRLNASFETSGSYTCLADNGKGVVSCFHLPFSNENLLSSPVFLT